MESIVALGDTMKTQVGEVVHSVFAIPKIGPTGISNALFLPRAIRKNQWLGLFSWLNGDFNSLRHIPALSKSILVVHITRMYIEPIKQWPRCQTFRLRIGNLRNIVLSAGNLRFRPRRKRGQTATGQQLLEEVTTRCDCG